MNKKILHILLFLITMLCLSSCSISREITELEEETKLSERANMIRYNLIITPDKESFIMQFCKKVRDTEEFETQVSEIYAFIEQNKDAVSPQEKITLEPLSHQTRGVEYKNFKAIDWYVTTEQYVYQTIMPDQEDSKTWYYCYYSFTYYWQIKDKCSEDEVGLHYLTLKLLNTEEQVTVGTNRFTNEN